MIFRLTRRSFLGAAMATIVTIAASNQHAFAEPGAWSSEPVRIVVTFPPGGTSDFVARLIAKYLDSEFKQKTVLDYRPGAAGTVAADYVSKQSHSFLPVEYFVFI